MQGQLRCSKSGTNRAAQLWPGSGKNFITAEPLIGRTAPSLSRRACEDNGAVGYTGRAQRAAKCVISRGFNGGQPAASFHNAARQAGRPNREGPAVRLNCWLPRVGQSRDLARRQSPRESGARSAPHLHMEMRGPHDGELTLSPRRTAGGWKKSQALASCCGRAQTVGISSFLSTLFALSRGTMIVNGDLVWFSCIIYPGRWHLAFFVDFEFVR